MTVVGDQACHNGEIGRLSLFHQDKLTLGIRYLRAVADSFRHSAMDTSTCEIEGAMHLTVHGQSMPLDRYARAGLYVQPGTGQVFMRMHCHFLVPLSGSFVCR